VGQYGTPKCEFIAHLLRCAEPENRHLAGGKGCWVGAHPALAEQLADALLASRELEPALGPVSELRRQVAVLPGSRADFVLVHPQHGADAAGADAAPPTVLEVKMVVDTDYDRSCDGLRASTAGAVRFYAPEQVASAPAQPSAPVQPSAPPAATDAGEARGYRRSAIFPWGRAAQKGPDGERVVSSRAIKHLDELAALARGERLGSAAPGAAPARLCAALLFVVVREDAEAFRPNWEACPSFAAHLRAARDAGVLVLAHRVRFGDDGAAESLGALPIEWGPQHARMTN
jgi:DNA-binding sugar fermentation-stimulating protein